MSFAKKFKRAREKAGISVADAAQRIGVTRATIYLWESGDRKPVIEHGVTQERALQMLGYVDPNQKDFPPKSSAYYEGALNEARAECERLEKALAINPESKTFFSSRLDQLEDLLEYARFLEGKVQQLQEQLKKEDSQCLTSSVTPQRLGLLSGPVGE